VQSPASGSPVAAELIRRAQQLGLAGQAPADDHVRHAIGFLEALEAHGSRHAGMRTLDLGSGGGIPGLVIAERWPEISISLLDASEKRCQLLRDWILESGWSEHADVLCGRAEELGREAGLRGSFDAVVSRSFGPPPATVECAAPFLKLHGVLIVSDPPSSAGPYRWPSHGVGMVGLELASRIAEPYHFSIFRKARECPERFPRRTGVPVKRPLF